MKWVEHSKHWSVWWNVQHSCYAAHSCEWSVLTCCWKQMVPVWNVLAHFMRAEEHRKAQYPQTHDWFWDTTGEVDPEKRGPSTETIILCLSSSVFCSSRITLSNRKACNISHITRKLTKIQFISSVSFQVNKIGMSVENRASRNLYCNFFTIILRERAPYQLLIEASLKWKFLLVKDSFFYF